MWPPAQSRRRAPGSSDRSERIDRRRRRDAPSSGSDVPSQTRRRARRGHPAAWDSCRRSGLGLFEGDGAAAELTATVPARATSGPASRSSTLLRPDRRQPRAGRRPRQARGPRARAPARGRRPRGRRRPARYEARSIAWRLPRATAAGAADAAGGADRRHDPRPRYRFDRFQLDATRTTRARGSSASILVGAGDGRSTPRWRRRGSPSEAANRARELQSLPANVRPARLPRRAGARRSPRAHEAISGRGARPRADRSSAGMGGMLAVAGRLPRTRQLIVLRYSGGGSARAARPRRQDGHLRHRRDLDQARRGDAGHEDGHVRRSRGARGDGGDRRARARRST